VPIWGPYGTNKTLAEKVYLESDVPEAMVLRPPYVYGVGERLGREIKLWEQLAAGREIAVPKRAASVQLLHVSDLAAAVRRAVERPARDRQVFNIAPLEKVELAGLPALFGEVAGIEARSRTSDDPSDLVTFPYPPVDCLLDSTAAEDALGWRAVVALREGLREVYDDRFGGSSPDGPARRDMSLVSGRPLESPLPASVTAALLSTAERYPDRGMTFYLADGTVDRHSYADLVAVASDNRGRLIAAGAKQGDTAVLLFDHPVRFIERFWGCLFAGVVPAAMQADVAMRDRARLRSVVDLLENPRIIPAGLAADDLIELAAGGRLLDLDRVTPTSPTPAADDTATTDRPLLVLLTSGSTGRPKGVPLTHGNVLARTAAAAEVLGHGHDDVSLNWLPLDHVGGLVMHHLADVIVGAQQIHVNPNLITGNILRWLDLMSDHAVTMSWAPNFAFSRVNHALSAGVPGRWDLSPVRHIVNAGESIRPSVVVEFTRRLQQSGLQADSVIPAWGMSETTSAIVYALGFDPRRDGTRTFARLGRPSAGHEMRVVDADDVVVPQDRAGALQVRGAAVISSYLGDPAVTRAAVTADGWLRTGDVGRITDGELYLEGRDKDIVIINGNNVSCQELETRAGAVVGVDPSCVAACPKRSPDDDTDSLVLFFSPSPDADDIGAIARRVRQTLVSELRLNPSAVVAIAPAAFPRTSIGKMQRGQLLTLFEQNQLATLGTEGPSRVAPAESRPEPTSPDAVLFSGVWRTLLGLESVSLDDNLFALGADSLMVQQFTAAASASGKDVLPSDVYEQQTIRGLLAVGAGRAGNVGARPAFDDDVDATPDELDLIRSSAEREQAR
jgi:acyl-CoA synthetase (AMP-forming)/AMP-acid ligase II